jgi:hypothetical protein
LPQRQQLNTKQRRSSDPRDFYDWTSRNGEVYARPTDPYVKPAMPEVAQLLEGIKLVKSGLESYSAIQQTNIPKNKMNAQSEATEDYKSDPNNPNPDKKPKSFLNAGWGYDQAYYMAYGEAKGISFRNELNQSLKNNDYFMDSVNPDEDKNKLYQETWDKHFQGINNEYVMFGANSNIKTANSESEFAFNQAKYLKTKETYVNSQSAILKDQAQQYTDTDIENPVLVRQNIDNLYETTVKDSKLQSKDEYDGLFVDSFGTSALNFATEKVIKDGKSSYKYTTTEAAQKGSKLIQVLKTPNKDGVSLYDVKDANGNYKYRKFIDAYEGDLIRLVDNREQEDEKELKKTSDKEHARLFAKLFSGTNIDKEIEASYKAGILTDNDYENILLANRQAQAGDYDVNEDDLFKNTLENGIYAGTQGRIVLLLPYNVQQ